MLLLLMLMLLLCASGLYQSNQADANRVCTNIESEGVIEFVIYWSERGWSSAGLWFPHGVCHLRT